MTCPFMRGDAKFALKHLFRERPSVSLDDQSAAIRMSNPAADEVSAPGASHLTANAVAAAIKRIRPRLAGCRVRYTRA